MAHQLLAEPHFDLTTVLPNTYDHCSDLYRDFEYPDPESPNLLPGMQLDIPGVTLHRMNDVEGQTHYQLAYYGFVFASFVPDGWIFLFFPSIRFPAMAHVYTRLLRGSSLFFGHLTGSPSDWVIVRKGIDPITRLPSAIRQVYSVDSPTLAVLLAIGQILGQPSSSGSFQAASGQPASTPVVIFE